MFYEEILKNAIFSKASYTDLDDFEIKNDFVVIPNLATNKEYLLYLKDLSFIDDPATDTQYYLYINNKTLYIVFRGTDSCKDKLSNILFMKKTIPYNNYKTKIRIHAGFLSRYKSDKVRPRIHSYITDAISDIHITGHSYGAALAALCAVDLQYNFKKNMKVILFGCPRVGNQSFMKSYNKRIPNTARVENGNDLVTKIPFKFLDYHHVGTDIHFGAKRTLALSLSDHDIENYICEISDAIVHLGLVKTGALKQLLRLYA